jgi:hypothetical protein
LRSDCLGHGDSEESFPRAAAVTFGQPIELCTLPEFGVHCSEDEREL